MLPVGSKKWGTFIGSSVRIEDPDINKNISHIDYPRNHSLQHPDKHHPEYLKLRESTHLDYQQVSALFSFT